MSKAPRLEHLVVNMFGYLQEKGVKSSSKMKGATGSGLTKLLVVKNDTSEVEPLFPLPFLTSNRNYRGIERIRASV